MKPASCSLERFSDERVSGGISLRSKPSRVLEPKECKVTGVDIMEGPEGPVVIEINSQPGWRGLQSVTKTVIADEIISYILSELKA